jgi:NAD(P)-dependent dehydrogenase (short-subunit alcohol dehydrogenase family)
MSLNLPITPSLRLDGKRALVTGASKGLGFAAAAALCAAGAHVVMIARTAADLEAAADAIRGSGGSAETVALDVTDTGAISTAVDQQEVFDILVNNAGLARIGPLTDLTEADYDAVMTINVRATYFLTQAVVRKMLAAKRRGSIINMSSQSGHVGIPQRSLYCTSKFALEGMTKALALELAPQGIRVNTICPTIIETDLTRKAMKNPANLEWALSRIRLGRLGQVEDVMGPLLLLASDASSLMTGSAVMVDAGWTAG